MSKLDKLAQLIRYLILTSTTEAGSGHPTSCLSAVELMVGLLFGGVFRFETDFPELSTNDRLIFSKGHAAPLLYALWAVAGAIPIENLKTLRKLGSPFEGHPTVEFPYAEVATGSLGQGLSVGVGMALSAKYLDKLPYCTYVLLGDSEMSEGSNWEALQIAAYYQLDNLVGIIDVNRLGQRGETMYGHNLDAYQRRVSAFGWETVVIDGHSFAEVSRAYQKVLGVKDKPTMIIAKTAKGRGVSFCENQEGWHGKALSKDELKRALQELGKVDLSIRGELTRPPKAPSQNSKPKTQNYNPEVRINDEIGESSLESFSTRQAFGEALVKLFPKYPEIVVLDAEVSNSTYSETFKKAYPERFFEMFLAEQNMVGLALGLSARGKIPFVSTFSAFFTRAFDQIRMAALSKANIKFVGSHAGVSIGEDGPSQMGLEDLSMFRSLPESVVLYPADRVSTEKLVEEAAKRNGIVYLRTTRPGTLSIYHEGEDFQIGKSKVLRKSDHDQVTVIAAGITLPEALKAYEELKKQGIFIRVIDLYSIKPIDEEVLTRAVSETRALLTVEDHYEAGGIGETVRSVLSGTPALIYSSWVGKIPKSGKPAELLSFEEIDSKAIVRKVRKILR